tara:strand:- start:131 stop:472 length:342 start_codon:yes stop_codon:yes gene_type:complete
VIKKLIILFFFSLSFSWSAYADCYNDLDVEHKWYDVKYPYQQFTFKNKSKNIIEITRVGIYAKGTKDVVIQWDTQQIVFDYRQITFSYHYLGDLNPDILGERYYACKYNYDFE